MTDLQSHDHQAETSITFGFIKQHLVCIYFSAVMQFLFC